MRILRKDARISSTRSLQLVNITEKQPHVGCSTMSKGVVLVKPPDSLTRLVYELLRVKRASPGTKSELLTFHEILSIRNRKPYFYLDSLSVKMEG